MVWLVDLKGDSTDENDKKLLLLTSMVILFPILWGLIIWPQLPNQIPIHFNLAGQANNFQSKPLAVFGLPLFLLLVHSVCDLYDRT